MFYDILPRKHKLMFRGKISPQNTPIIYHERHILYFRGKISAYLYGRVDTDIQLKPFTLSETEQMLEQKGVEMSRFDIMEGYMAIGGIPYYLNQLKPGLHTNGVVG